MTPAELSRAVLTTVRRAVDAAELAVEVPEKIAVQRPPHPGRGDYATNVALQLAGPAGRSPHDVAEILRRRLVREPGIAQVQVAGAGFLNITLSSRAYDVVVGTVRAQRGRYGHGESLSDERVTVAADQGAVRGTLVAEVVNGLLRAAGAAPAAPGTPPEHLTVAEPAPILDQSPVLGPVLGRTPSPGPISGSVPAPPPVPCPAQTPAQAQAQTPAQQPGPVHPPTLPALETLLGPDATRWALLRPPAEDPPRLDAAARAALLSQREANPLFRIQYAHARTRALLRNAHDLGIVADDGTQPAYAAYDDAGAPAYHPAETDLLGLVADFPRVVEAAARRRGPDRVARHLERLADAFARFHDECRVLPKGEEKPSAVHAARLRLTEAAGIVLADGLRLLGISAPDRI